MINLTQILCFLLLLFSNITLFSQSPVLEFDGEDTFVGLSSLGKGGSRMSLSIRDLSITIGNSSFMGMGGPIGQTH